MFKKFFSIMFAMIICFNCISTILASEDQLIDYKIIDDQNTDYQIIDDQNTDDQNTDDQNTDDQIIEDRIIEDQIIENQIINEKAEKEMKLMQELLEQAKDTSIFEAGTQTFETFDEDGNSVKLEINTAPAPTRRSFSWIHDGAYTNEHGQMYAGSWKSEMSLSGTYCGTIGIYADYDLFRGVYSWQHEIKATKVSHYAYPPGNMSLTYDKSHIDVEGPSKGSYVANVHYYSSDYNGFYRYYRMILDIWPRGFDGIQLESNLWYDFTD